MNPQQIKQVRLILVTVYGTVTSQNYPSQPNNKPAAALSLNYGYKTLRTRTFCSSRLVSVSFIPNSLWQLALAPQPEIAP